MYRMTINSSVRKAVRIRNFGRHHERWNTLLSILSSFNGTRHRGTAEGLNSIISNEPLKLSFCYLVAPQLHHFCAQWTSGTMKVTALYVVRVTSLSVADAAWEMEMHGTQSTQTASYVGMSPNVTRPISTVTSSGFPPVHYTVRCNARYITDIYKWNGCIYSWLKLLDKLLLM